MQSKIKTPLLSILALSLLSVSPSRAEGVQYLRDVKPIIERNCISCHACFDAPCQLKMTSTEGLERGASKLVVYGTRLKAVSPTRLFLDAESTAEWRAQGFWSVTEDRLASLMAKMLELGRKNGLEPNKPWSKKIDHGVLRENTCPKLDEFEKYAKKHPQEGMPFLTTGLTQPEYDTLRTWLDEGGKTETPAPKVTPAERANISIWEEFLNQKGLREQLVSRYIYEHLYIAHLYFEGGEKDHFFELVRSSTPPGSTIHVVKAVRPNSDPGETFYYRIRPLASTVVVKTHITYPLSPAKLERIQALFFQPQWDVSELPAYTSAQAINPFRTFDAIPAQSRYRFLLDDAAYYIRTFIRGPVCRGQIATDVIDDHFFNFFQAPDKDLFVLDQDYARSQYDDLAMPGSKSTNKRLGPTKWLSAEKSYQKRRNQAYAAKIGPTGWDHIWDGDGSNPAALLTVFRHHDSATVLVGLVGEVPKTAWIMDYPLLERTIYSLVVNFDTFAAAGHGLHTRLYFDLIRAESEANFLRFVPKKDRQRLRKSWYKGLMSGMKLRLVYEKLDEKMSTTIHYSGDNIMEQFTQGMLKQFAQVAGPTDTLNRCSSKPCQDATLTSASQQHVEGELQQLANLPARKAPFIEFLPDNTFLRISSKGGEEFAYALVRNRWHKNVAFLVGESRRYEPKKDTLTITRGPIGSYPNFIFNVPQDEIETFVTECLKVRKQKDFDRIVEAFGIRRTHPEFWDNFHFFTDYMKQHDPIEAGVYDANRYSNL
jgi:hypothetical protein